MQRQTIIELSISDGTSCSAQWIHGNAMFWMHYSPELKRLEEFKSAAGPLRVIK